MKNARIQTAFRLPQELLARVKREAKRRNQSVNAFVEEVLDKETGLKLPKLPKNYAISADDLFSYKGHIPSPTQEMLNNDPKLAHIWNKGV